MDLEINTDIAIQQSRGADAISAKNLRVNLLYRIEEQQKQMLRPVLDQLADLRSQTNPELTETRAYLIRLQNEGTLLHARVIALNQIQNLQIKQQELSLSASDATRNPADRAQLNDEFQSTKEQIEQIRSSQLNGIPLFPEGREVVSGPGDPLYKRLRSEITEPVTDDDHRFLNKDIRKELFDAPDIAVTTHNLSEKSLPAEKLAEDSVPIYTPTNGGEEQLTVLDREGFIQFGKSISAEERIIYDVDNSFLRPPAPDYNREAEQVQRPPQRVGENTYLGKAPPAPSAPPETPVVDEVAPGRSSPDQERATQEILAIGQVEDPIPPFAFPDKIRDDGLISPSYLPIDDLQILTIEETKLAIQTIHKDFDQTVEFIGETVEALKENRNDLESATRLNASSDIDITNPDEHLPQISPMGYDNFYGSQAHIHSTHTIALLRA